MKVLITGANGFIGNRLMEEFGKKGHDVYGIDRIEVKHKNVDAVNLENREEIKKYLLSNKPNLIIHCAGSADVAKSVQNPQLDFQSNVVLTHNLLFGLHELGMHAVRVVFLSSAAVYGNPKELPIKEDALLNPLSPYAIHKKICEDLCIYMRENYGMDIRIARIFSAYGKGLKKQIFWDLYQKCKMTGEICVYGTGAESRDYIHVEEVCQAIYLIALCDCNDYIFNVANGEEIQIKTVVEAFARAAGIPHEKIHYSGELRKGDPINWKADIDRIIKMGYKKTVCMQDALEEYYQWILKEESI